MPGPSRGHRGGAWTGAAFQTDLDSDLHATDHGETGRSSTAMLSGRMRKEEEQGSASPGMTRGRVRGTGGGGADDGGLETHVDYDISEGDDTAHPAAGMATSSRREEGKRQ